jgi:hypothetical protein
MPVHICMQLRLSFACAHMCSSRSSPTQLEHPACCLNGHKARVLLNNRPPYSLQPGKPPCGCSRATSPVTRFASLISGEIGPMQEIRTSDAFNALSSIDLLSPLLTLMDLLYISERGNPIRARIVQQRRLKHCRRVSRSKHVPCWPPNLNIWHQFRSSVSNLLCKLFRCVVCISMASFNDKCGH